MRSLRPTGRLRSSSLTTGRQTPAMRLRAASATPCRSRKFPMPAKGPPGTGVSRWRTDVSSRFSTRTTSGHMTSSSSRWLPLSPILPRPRVRPRRTFREPGTRSRDDTKGQTPDASDARHPPQRTSSRRSVFDRVGMFESRWRLCSWVDWYMRATDLGLQVEVLPATLTKCRVHRANCLRVKSRQHGDYVRALKASLDRRRLAGAH